ncbi:MAG: hypothetical protein EBS59_03050 [Verrucomicrobia bacterium]|nr:hypothetical protein [Verrucomicrobiota bacterium]
MRLVVMKNLNQLQSIYYHPNKLHMYQMRNHRDKSNPKYHQLKKLQNLNLRILQQYVLYHLMQYLNNKN